MSTELSDILQSIEREELVPVFQPIVEIRSGVLVGFEVLARWNHPTQGLVLPANFIALAEEHGLIGDVMRQVFSRAFAAARQVAAHIRLTLNISPVQMSDLTLPRQLAEIAAAHEFPMNRITVEITESGLLLDLECAARIAGEFKAMGCRIALDDFGTGYSSLHHLQALPFDVLKIDRSFVKSMGETRASRKIVASTIGLGHSLGLRVIAEGIETVEHVNMLLWLGCEFGQGWLYGRPVAAAQLEAAIAGKPYEPAAVSLPGEGWPSHTLESAPMERLAQLQAIYDGAPVGLAFLDREIRYMNLNSRLAAINGLSVEAHLGRTMMELFPAAYAILQPYLKRALQGEAIPKVEILRPPTVEGSKAKSLIISYQPVMDEAGEVIGISAAVLDVTEYKRPRLVEAIAMISTLLRSFPGLSKRRTVPKTGVRPADAAGIVPCAR